MNRTVIALTALVVGAVAGWVMVDKGIKKVFEDEAVKSDSETETDSE